MSRIPWHVFLCLHTSFWRVLFSTLEGIAWIRSYLEIEPGTFYLCSSTELWLQLRSCMLFLCSLYAAKHSCWKRHPWFVQSWSYSVALIDSSLWQTWMSPQWDKSKNLISPQNSTLKMMKAVVETHPESFPFSSRHAKAIAPKLQNWTTNLLSFWAVVLLAWLQA